MNSALILIGIFVIVAGLAYALMRLAPRAGLMALPGEHRKHQEPTPMVGGIAIFAGIFAGIYLLSPQHLVLLPAMLLLLIVGVLDDRFKLSSTLRLFAQAAAAGLMIYFADAELSNLGAVFSSRELTLGRWSVALTIFATIGVINAVNMSDGMDGLAGCLVILVLLALVVAGSGQEDFILITIFAAGGFLFWNLRIGREQARVFMGDAGSTLLGLLIAYLLISDSQQPEKHIYPVTALWLLALPLIDTVAVLLVRPLRGQSPFSADRFHYHHLLEAKGLGVNQTLGLVLLLQSVLILVGWIMLEAGVAERYQMMLFLLCFVAYTTYLLRTTKT